MTDIPENINNILLVNPTKYLGNLLIAGGLIQDFSRYCRSRGWTLTVVLDANYQSLVSDSLRDAEVIYYPRKQLATGSFLSKFLTYLKFLRQIRKNEFDLAFVLEEDIVAHRLIRHSRAHFKLGCATHRHRKGFDCVVPVNYRNRPLELQHRWFCYKEVFAKLGMTDTSPGYMNLEIEPAGTGFLKNLGIRTDIPVVLVHAGASRDYKKWPVSNFTQLCGLLQEKNIQPVLIGAGEADAGINRKIISALSELSSGPHAADICNKVNLKQLARIMMSSSAMVGNDSGPFHLGSALNVPGITIYGPTEPELWGPLGTNSKIVQGDRVCTKACREPECVKDHSCLKSVSVEQIFRELLSLPVFTMA